jgi:hypothetical protein
MTFALDTNIVSFALKGMYRIADKIIDTLDSGTLVIKQINNQQHFSHISGLILEDWSH